MIGAVLRAITALVPLAASLSGCSQQTVVLPSRDFERPTDMTFACVGIFSNGEGKDVTLVGQPMANCHPPGVMDAPDHSGVPDFTASTFRTYAFVPNAARGDLSAIDMSYCRADVANCYPPGAQIVDLDPDSIGYAAAPVGELPEVITASQDGCRVVTANRGSCDLTLVNPSVLLAPSVVPTQQRDKAKAALNTYGRTVVPRTSAGRLAVAPGEIAFVPQQTSGRGGPVPEVGQPIQGNAAICDVRDEQGVITAEGTSAAPVGAPPAAPGELVSWRVVVTFPSCDLVALMELPSGDILDSYQVDATASGLRYVHSGRDPVCPVRDCGPGAGVSTPPAGVDAGVDTGGFAGDDGAADAAAGDATVDTTAEDGTGADGGETDAAATAALVTGSSGASLRVSALAMHPEGKRVYFGAPNTPFVGALDLTGAGDTLAPPAAGGSTRLEGGAGGVTRLRLSVDPYAYSKGRAADDAATRAEYGRFVAGPHDDQPGDPLEFIYVIARDGSVRVIDIGRATPPFECDLGIDPADAKAGALDPDDTTRVGCFPYPAAGVDGPRRFQYAGPPGLRFASPAQDVAFANYRTPLLALKPPSTVAQTASLNEQTLNGAFAFVLTVAGSVQIINIDPVLRRLGQVVRQPDGTLEKVP
ncbi:MAG: hypothetical protein ABUR63_05810, partial [Verrucomicrobiota bacterium]